jgi:L-threonylcarbamoyladenylate synthase
VEKNAPTRATVLPTDTPASFDAAVSRAVELLQAGEVVALPTETVYGLAANALDPRAVARVFEVKGRPVHNPVIVHVASLDMARDCVANWPALAQELAASFWPGPLTLVLPRAANIPPAVTAGGPTVGIRWPNHQLIRAVIQACGFPLAAPSANLATQVSPTCARHVLEQLGTRIPLIVDGGPSRVGIESAVLDISVSPPRLLRPGMIHEQALVSVTGELAQGDGEGGTVLRSPGLLRKHYAPRARLVIWSWDDERDLLARLAECHMPAARTHILAHTRIPAGSGLGHVSVLPRNARAFARTIYAELHQCDAAGAEWIVVEALPEGGEWKAIADRLNRAGSS